MDFIDTADNLTRKEEFITYDFDIGTGKEMGYICLGDSIMLNILEGPGGERYEQFTILFY